MDKKRILFVDNEPKFLGLYRMLFGSGEESWNVEFVEDGFGALQAMDSARTDVLVSKWRLPGIAAGELIAAVKELHPETSWIVSSESGDREDVARLLGHRHEFVALPLDPDALHSTVSRVCAIKDPGLDARLAQLLSKDFRLPSLPSLYFRVVRAMESPDASIDEIGEIIAEDPAMTAKILQAVNSAYCAMARRITNIVEAVQLLGLQRVRAMVLSAQVFSCFDQVKMKAFPHSRVWSHSIAASQIAQKICRLERVDRTVAEEAQLACMLHDVGKVILASGDPERYQDAVRLANKRRQALWQTETELFGVSHADVGAYLFGQWGLPISLIEAVALHHAPERTVLDEFTPLAILHVVNHLEAEMSGSAFNLETSPLAMEYLARIGMKNRVDEWRDAVQEVEVLA